MIRHIPLHRIDATDRRSGLMLACVVVLMLSADWLADAWVELFFKVIS